MNRRMKDQFSGTTGTVVECYASPEGLGGAGALALALPERPTNVPPSP